MRSPVVMVPLLAWSALASDGGVPFERVKVVIAISESHTKGGKPAVPTHFVQELYRCLRDEGMSDPEVIPPDTKGVVKVSDEKKAQADLLITGEVTFKEEGDSLTGNIHVVMTNLRTQTKSESTQMAFRMRGDGGTANDADAMAAESAEQGAQAIAKYAGKPRGHRP